MKRETTSYRHPQFRGARLALLSFIAGAVTCLCGNLAAADASVTGAKKELIPIKVGHLLVPGQGKIFIAQEKGFFKDAGLDVELVEFQNSADSSAAIRAGKLDFASSGATAPLFHIAKGADNIVIVGGIHNEDAAVIATPEKAKTIKSLADLKGKKIAVIRLSTGDSALRGWLVEHNIIPGKDIQIFELKNPPAVIEAVRSGEVDAGAVWEPHIVRAREAGLTVIATSRDILPNHPCCRLIANKDLVEKHPEIVEAFLTAFLRAEVFGIDHRAEAVDILTKYIKVDRYVVDESYVNDQPTDPDIANTKRFWEVMNEVGYADPNKKIEDYINVTIYKRALDKLRAAEPHQPLWQKLEAAYLVTDAPYTRADVK
jgi:NitT/TauT family transport system substrate-binding protein